MLSQDPAYGLFAEVNGVIVANNAVETLGPTIQGDELRREASLGALKNVLLEALPRW